MKKIITASLTGAALNWAVAKCEGIEDAHWDEDSKCFRDDWDANFEPSSSWSQGGPIVEREKITIHAMNGNPTRWVAHTQDMRIGDHVDGPCPLEAAMRCFVASKLGDEVEVPEELCE